MSDLAFKRGSTLSLAGVCKLPAGTWSASSKVQLLNGTKVSLDVTLIALGAPGADGETHSITITKAANSTATWTIGRALIDILFTDTAGNSVPTETFELEVQSGVTSG